MRPSARGQTGAARDAEMCVAFLRAVVALALGVSVLGTAKTDRAVANYIAIYWLLGSVVTLRWALAQRERSGSRPALVAALVGIAAGVVVLLRFLLADVLSVVVVLGLLGVAAILTGALRLSGALHDDPVVGDRRTPLSRILGVLEIALGAVLIGTPLPTRATAVAVGLWALAAGAILLSHALAIWRANRRTRHALSARSE